MIDQLLHAPQKIGLEIKKILSMKIIHEKLSLGGKEIENMDEYILRAYIQIEN